MKFSKAIIIGSLIYAVITSIRFIFLNLHTNSILVEFILKNIALYSIVALISTALNLRDIKFIIFTAVLAPIYAVIGVIYSNIAILGLNEYLGSYDFQTALRIMSFAFIGSLVASTVVVKILGNTKSTDV